MPGIPLPPGVAETAGAIWLGVRSAFPASCFDTESHCHKPETGTFEMKGVDEKRCQDGEIIPRSDSIAGVESDHDMITEWQAGWKVTNAIQVSILFYYPHRASFSSRGTLDEEKLGAGG